jgi:hypothetical protein
MHSWLCSTCRAERHSIFPLLVNLAKGKIGEDTAALLRGMLVTKIGLAALSRSNLPEADRRDFYLYADEFRRLARRALPECSPR